MSAFPLRELRLWWVVVLELFERVTGEAFSDTPGVVVGQRVRGIAKVLGNISREEAITPPLVSTTRVHHSGRMVVWNRQPHEEIDVRAWRRRVEALEARAPPVPRLRTQMTSVDTGLAAWIHDHQLEAVAAGMAEPPLSSF